MGDTPHQSGIIGVKFASAFFSFSLIFLVSGALFEVETFSV